MSVQQECHSLNKHAVYKCDAGEGCDAARHATLPKEPLPSWRRLPSGCCWMTTSSGAISESCHIMSGRFPRLPDRRWSPPPPCEQQGQAAISKGVCEPSTQGCGGTTVSESKILKQAACDVSRQQQCLQPATH